MPGIVFQLHGKGACNKRSQEHDDKSDGIARVMGQKAVSWRCKQKVKHKHTDNGRDQAVYLVPGHHRGDQNAENIDGDDVDLREAQLVKDSADKACSDQNADAFCDVGKRKRQCCFSVLFGIVISGIGRRIVGNDIDIQIGGCGNELVGKRRFAEKIFSGGGAPSYDDFGNAGNPSELRNLQGYVIAVHRLDVCAKLLCQACVFAQAFLSFSFREEKSEVSTNRAVKAARKALAILAAVRMIRPLEGAGTDRLKCARPCDSLFGFWNAHPLSRDSPGQRIALGQFREVR